MSAPTRRSKLDREHPDLSVRRQCEMLGVARSCVTRKPAPAPFVRLRRQRSGAHAPNRCGSPTERPFLGSRRIAKMLSDEGLPINRKRVRRLMRLMGEAGQRFQQA